MKEGSWGCLEAKPYRWSFQDGIGASFSATQSSSANKRNLETCQARSGLIASLAWLSLPFSPVPLGSLFLRAPQAGEPVPSGFIKTLVAFLNICSIFTVVPSHLSAVSLFHGFLWYYSPCCVIICFYGWKEAYAANALMMRLFLWGSLYLCHCSQCFLVIIT